MNKSSFTRLAAAAVATGIASLALAMPASARTAIDPEVGTPGPVFKTSPGPSSGTDWGQLATGAAGGIALVGVGAAAVAGTRRHNHHMAHPA